MRKNKLESPESYFEREPKFLIIFMGLALSVFVGYYFLFRHLVFEYHYVIILLFPLVFFLLINTLFILFNPLVNIYKDRMEIIFFMFLKKTYYFCDIKKIYFDNGYNLWIKYHDDESEKIPFFPIKKSEKDKFINLVYKKILEHSD